MVFSSLNFMFVFLPAVLIVYFLSPRVIKNLILFLASLLFYAWGEPVYVGLMLFSTVVDYTHGWLVQKYRGTRKAKIFLLSSVLINLAVLGFFKYSDFIIGNLNAIPGVSLPLLELSLPIGISFYTFQTMSYTIDVYRGDAKAQRNIISFGAYVSLFPQLVAGPIVRYSTIAEQLNHRRETFDLFGDGVQRFVIGLGKKVLLANSIGAVWTELSSLPNSELSVAGAWIGAVAYTFQIYFDFSGYSDMAIGLGKIFGFQFLENFQYPYISKSITEFWRRWHISLGTWFREYMYIPLGGNRVSRPRLFFNLLVVWAATGIWHGASWNFLLWGLYFAALLILEKAVLLRVLEKLPRALQHLYAIFLAVVSWAIFAVEDLGHLGVYLKAMFGFAQGGLADGAFRYHLVSYLPVLLIAAVASTPLGVKLWKRLPERPMKLILPVLLLAGLTLSTAYLVDATYNPFLYFRF